MNEGAQRLAEWRARKGLTQVAAAREVGVDQGRYSQFERGVRAPGRKRAVRIATATKGWVPVASWDIPCDADAASV